MSLSAGNSTLAIAALVLAGLAPAAEGATVAVVDPELAQVEFTAVPGETNRLTVTAAEGPARLIFRDSGAAITPGTGCAGGGEPGVAVECAMPGAQVVAGATLFVALDDGDDSVDASLLPRPFASGSLAPEFRGGAGSDTILGGEGVDKIVPGAGDDRAFGARGDDYLVADPTPDGTDLIKGGEGRDFASYGGRIAPVKLTIAGSANDGTSGEGDSLVGVEGLAGGVGADTLVGSPSTDFLVGSGGSDRIIGERSGDLIDAGAGADSVSGDEGDDALAGGGDDDRLAGGKGNDSLRGGGGADRLRGADGADALVGNSGPDLLDGGGGADRINAIKGTTVPDAPADPDASRDRIDCGAGTDRLTAEPRDRHRRCERVNPRS